MTHAQQLAAAREAVLQVAGESDLSEVILIKDGYYAGHRFAFEGGYAVWFLDEQQVKIHRHDGALLKVVLMGKVDRRAA